MRIKKFLPNLLLLQFFLFMICQDSESLAVYKKKLMHISAFYLFPGLWGIVNNAGIAGPIGPVQWLTREDYRSTFEINTLGIVETTRIFLPLVLKEKGRIVNITSMMGRIAAANSTYVVSKFAAEGYSDILR